jgi:hypothetical protein
MIDDRLMNIENGRWMNIENDLSFVIELAELVPAEARVRYSFVVVVVDVVVANHSWELGLIQLFAAQKVHLLQLAHSQQQSCRTIDRISIGSQ